MGRVSTIRAECWIVLTHRTRGRCLNTRHLGPGAAETNTGGTRPRVSIGAYGIRRPYPKLSQQGLWVRTVHPVQEFSLTPSLHRKSYHIYTKCKLRKSDSCKPYGDGNSSHRHGIYPEKTSSGIGSLDDRTGSKPDSQQHLCEEGANDSHEDGVERCFFASRYIRT